MSINNRNWHESQPGKPLNTDLPAPAGSHKPYWRGRPKKEANIGILTTSIRPGRPQKASKILAELAFFIELARESPHNIYVFSPWGIDWHNRKVKAYRIVQADETSLEWEAYQAPMPDAVYDQIYNRNEEYRYREIRSQLKKTTGGRYFNARYLNKNEVHALLRKTPGFERCLPETVRFRSIKELRSMMAKHEIIYLKPIGGSLGLGIMRAGYNREMRCYYVQSRRGRIRSADSIESLFKIIRPLMKDQHYLLQQGIALLRQDGRIVDFRVLLQKNSRGDWSITKQYARVGAEKSITSNLAGGGTAYPVETVLTEAFSEPEIERIRNELKELAYRTAETIEETSGELFGEFGIDLGVDVKGKIWLIEVNSKPRRRTEGKGNENLIVQSFLKPLRYAGYLAGKEQVER